MINHARSLILNVSPADRPEVGTFGEEYIPTDYKVLDYAGPLNRIRGKLVGTAGDPLYENYRLMQLMSLLHANQYSEELVLSLDDRYTYRPFSPSFMDFDASIEVEEVDAKNLQLTASGDPESDETVGKSLYRWTVRTEAGPQLWTKEAIINQWRQHDVIITGTDVSPVELENGVILQVSIPSGSWTAGAEWLVTSMARPVQDIGFKIDVLNGLGVRTVEDLFQSAPKQFRTLWYEGISLVDQLGGVLGAFVYAAENIRQNV